MARRKPRLEEYDQQRELEEENARLNEENHGQGVAVVLVLALYGLIAIGIVMFLILT